MSRRPSRRPPMTPGERRFGDSEEDGGRSLGPRSARRCGAARQGSVGSSRAPRETGVASSAPACVAVALVVSVAILRGVLDPLWTAATRHRFLDAVREGTITDLAFDRWLGQDALFVGDLLTFQARLLARAPRPAQAVLAGGCVALVAELDWFEVQAARRGIDLGFAVPTAGRDGVRAASACQLGAVGDPGAGIFGRSGVRSSSLIMYQVVTVMYAPQMTTGK